MIDAHHHLEPTGHNQNGRSWSIQMALEQMDESGVTSAMAYAGPILGDPSSGARLACRKTNEWAAEICRAHPGRFGRFASLPMEDADSALDEIAYAFDELHVDGVGIAPRYGEAWLGDVRFRPIFEELDRRSAVVYIHPTRAGSCEAIATLNTTDGVIAAPWIEYPTDTARTVLSLWSARITRDYPNLRFLLCHGGGVLPILLGRFDGFRGWPAVGQERFSALFPDGVYAEFAKLYLECAQAYAPETIAMLRTLTQPSHLLFGTDFSYFPIAHSVRAFNALALPEPVRSAIAHDNAAALFGRWEAPA